MSLRASPGGLAPFQCHCSQREELTTAPFSSAKDVVGRRNTSVWIVLGSTSFNAPWFCQKAMVSVSSGSMLTMNFSLENALISLPLLGAEASGLKPWQM